MIPSSGVTLEKKWHFFSVFTDISTIFNRIEKLKIVYVDLKEFYNMA